MLDRFVTSLTVVIALILTFVFLSMSSGIDPNQSLCEEYLENNLSYKLYCDSLDNGYAVMINDRPATNGELLNIRIYFDSYKISYDTDNKIVSVSYIPQKR